MATFTAIDADGHVMEPQSMWTEYLETEFHLDAPRLVRDTDGRRRLLIAGRLHEYIPMYDGDALPRRGRVPRGGADPQGRLADLDEEGIEKALLYPTTGLFFASVEDPRVQAALCRAYNDWLYDYCGEDRSRLIGVALVPQADAGAAVAEARRAVERLGFRSVLLRPNPVAGRNLNDPYYEPLWACLQELDVTASIHEGTTQDLPQSGRDRFTNFLFRHACSHPHEQQMACLALICGGVLERHPRLRVAFLESGCGWIAHWLDRLDEHVEHWGHALPALPLAPSEYFARQCFISAEPEEKAIGAMAALVGEDKIVYASDYPHLDSIFPGSPATLAERSDLSDGLKRKLLYDNAAAAFRLGG